MKKELTVIVSLLLVLVSSSFFVSASEGHIIISLDSGNMGAVVRVLDPDTNDRVDDGVSVKNYNTGVVEVSYDVLYDEVKFLILITKEGNLIAKKTVGPFFVSDDLELDCRSGMGCKEVEEVVEEPSAAPSAVEKNDTNQNNQSSGASAPEPSPSVDSSTPEPSDTSNTVTGNVVQEGFLSTSNRWYIVIGIVAFLSLFTLAGLFIHKRKKKNALVNLAKKSNAPIPTNPPKLSKSPEELELEQLERKMQENESRIQSIKKRDETRKRLQDAKQKLMQEENELRQLENRNVPANKDNRQWGMR